MSARIIDGKTISADLRGKVTDAVHRLRRDRGLVPGLAVVLVGGNPASKVYVRNKSKAVTEAGLQSFDQQLPENVSEAELLDLIALLNADEKVNGILVQLPLPPQIDADKIIAAIDPDKDVDGFHPLNAGRLASGLPGLAPCTALGCVRLAKAVHTSLAGLEAVVIGRSNIVGKPVAQLLLAENATVTIAHSKTLDLPSVCARADLLIAAMGRPEMVRGGWIKPGATVIDVGIQGNCRRDHAGSRRRWADDYRLSAAQYAARRVHAERPAGAEDLIIGNASLPGVGDLVERLGAEALRGAGDRAAAERAIEFHRRLVIGQRPHHQALQAALHEVLARGGEQATAEAQPLELGTQIKLVDFAVIEQAARPVAPVVGVAGNLLAELQDGDAAALADGRVPPVRSAPVDQLAELVARDDALIGRPPCLVMGRGDVHRIGGLRTANLYESR